MGSIAVIALAVVVLIGAVIYSIKLQRRAVSTQSAVVDDHFAEKAQRHRHLALAEESLELQKRAIVEDAETRALLRRSVELNEEILKELRATQR